MVNIELNFSKEYGAFRDEVRTFIAENYPAEMRIRRLRP